MITQLNEVMNIIPGISEKKEGRLRIVVGIGMFSNMRDMLESEVFGGRPIRWREGSGWLQRTFEVAGPLDHIRQIQERVEH